jgi:hypothetical protein
MSNVIRFTTRPTRDSANDDPEHSVESIRRSIVELNATIKTMHTLWQVSPDAAGIELIVRWQELRDSLELLDVRSPQAREELEGIRSRLIALSSDLATWCQNLAERHAAH